jgi:hypothetical protein
MLNRKIVEIEKRGLVSAICERDVFDAAGLVLAVYAVGLCHAVGFIGFGEALQCEAIEEGEEAVRLVEVVVD